MLTKLSLLAREFVDLLRLIVYVPESLRRIVFYSTEASYFRHYEGIITQLTQGYGCGITYVTSAPGDPLLRSPPLGVTVLYVNALVPALMRLLDARVLVTTVPDLGKFKVPRPRPATRLVYAFHAIVSTHMMYRLGAFDHYDVIFCAGPHHKLELSRHREIYGVARSTLIEVGHPKIDSLAEDYRAYVKQHQDAPTVLLAAGWGDSHVLGTRGEEIIDRLLAAGYRVVARPHPELLRRAPGVLQRLSARFRADPLFTLDRDISSVESLLEADVMISDWSGVAFEYAFATERPVISIDFPRKVRNPEWERLNVPPLEDFGRQSIGPVVGIEDIARIDRIVARLVPHRGAYRTSTVDLRNRHLYNRGHSSQVAARHIRDLG